MHLVNSVGGAKIFVEAYLHKTFDSEVNQSVDN